jgi:hypothetical protein
MRSAASSPRSGVGVGGKEEGEHGAGMAGALVAAHLGSTRATRYQMAQLAITRPRNEPRRRAG